MQVQYHCQWQPECQPECRWQLPPPGRRHSLALALAVVHGTKLHYDVTVFTAPLQRLDHTS